MSVRNPLSLRLDLLDNQVVDSHRLPLGRVDDLNLTIGADGAVTVAALLVGQQALGQRLGGTLGRWLSSSAQRLRTAEQKPGPVAVGLDLVQQVHPMVTLTVAAAQLPQVAPLEGWLSQRVISHLPGSGS